jgi:hypothetical protein
MLKKVSIVVLLFCGSLAAQSRLDVSVRNDMVAGFTGNLEALHRAMTACEKLLAENPDNAEALVWHGAGTLVQSRLEGETDMQKRIALFQKGTSEMDRAVSLEPNNIAIRIPRGGTLRMATPGMPNYPILKTLIENARTDYQMAFDLQKDHLDQIGTHPLGELLQGLGDLNSRQGKADDAEKYYRMIQDRMPGTVYAQRAAEWMKSKQPLPPEKTACVGCHAAR